MTVANLERACPHCGRINDAHDGPQRGQEPTAGDVSICWACGGLAFFTDRGMRKPTSVEMTELLAAPEIRTAQAVIRESYTPRQASALRWGAGS